MALDYKNTAGYRLIQREERIKKIQEDIRQRKKVYDCYENGKHEQYTEQDLRRYFDRCEELQSQKDQGTTFESWLHECVQMQILIPRS